MVFFDQKVKVIVFTLTIVRSKLWKWVERGRSFEKREGRRGEREREGIRDVIDVYSHGGGGTK